MKIALLFTILISFNLWAKNSVVTIETNMGNVDVEIFEDKAPETAKNFLKYVDDKFYDGTIFHRVIKGFMIQGGGYNEKMAEKKTRPAIKNEATNGLANEVGTISMARTSDPHSATAQFFINVNDNSSLNHVAPTNMGYGYAVFGKVVNGMHVVNRITMVKTGNLFGHGDVPMDTVLIKTIKRKI